MIGMARIVCAIIMAEGVNSNPRKPSGPEWESARYRARPTTTGGRPKKALIKTTMARRPRNEKTASAAPTGRLIAAAINVAVTLMPIESPTISVNSFTKRNSCRRNAFDLDQQSLGEQPGDFHERDRGGGVRLHALEEPVAGAPVVRQFGHVADKDSQLDEIRRRAADAGKRHRKILESSFGLRFEIAASDQLAIGVERRLTRQEDQPARPHLDDVGVARRIFQFRRVDESHL